MQINIGDNLTLEFLEKKSLCDWISNCDVKEGLACDACPCESQEELVSFAEAKEMLEALASN